jgi:hypothetical protein
MQLKVEKRVFAVNIMEVAGKGTLTTTASFSKRYTIGYKSLV